MYLSLKHETNIPSIRCPSGYKPVYKNIGFGLKSEAKCIRIRKKSQ